MRGSVHAIVVSFRLKMLTAALKPDILSIAL